MKEHMQGSRLHQQVFAYFREKWEEIQDVEEIEKLRTSGYDFKEKSHYFPDKEEHKSE